MSCQALLQCFLKGESTTGNLDCNSFRVSVLVLIALHGLRVTVLVLSLRDSLVVPTCCGLLRPLILPIRREGPPLLVGLVVCRAERLLAVALLLATMMPCQLTTIGWSLSAAER